MRLEHLHVFVADADIAEFRKASEAVYKNTAVTDKWTPGLVERVAAIIAGTGK